MRCAIAMRDAARSLGAELTDFPPRLRIGLDIGEVVAGALGGDLRLAGEAGVGKTTLARAATAPPRPGARVLWGRCLPQRHRLPLWPVREVLAAAAGVPVTVAAAVCRLIGLELDEQPGPPNELGARELAATVAGVLAPAALTSLVHEEGGNLEQELDALTSTGLIERLPDQLTGDRGRYAFHHVLFQDIAYSLLPKASRSELHERLAVWLGGELGAEREPPEAIAPHLVEAVRLAGEIRRPTAADRVLATRAVAVCRHAAQRLREQEALALCGNDDQAGLAIDLRPTLLPVRLYLARPLDELAGQAHELATTARAHGLRNAEAGANWVLGEVRALQGDLIAAERHFTAADQQRRDIGLISDRVWSLLGLARVAVARGGPARARGFAEEAIAVTSRPDGLAEPDAFPHVEARLATANGDHQAAARLLWRSLATLDSTDYRLERLRTATELVTMLVTTGYDVDAAALARDALRQATAIGAHALVRELERARR